MEVISYSKEYEWRDLAFFGDGVPCDRCKCEPLPADIGVEVMTDDRSVRIICKRCADEIISGVKNDSV